ncbi:MAG: hypothetical protein Q9186_002828 [Xanthomendoza sp. 1 TL-2023]
MPNSARKLLPTSWKSTLILPKSAFPPRSLLADQPTYLQRCSDDLYRWQQRTRNPPQSPEFVLHDGPPFANGPLHMGHALNKILKDITCRFQLALGKRIKYVPGWDCHGLPIEIKALELQKENHGWKDPMKIREAACQLATAAISTQKAEFQRWGIMADWENAWKSMDKDFELRQLGVFSSMVKSGLISRRFKPVYWSPSSHTALAEAELEYRDDHPSTAAYIKYTMLLARQGQTLPVGLLVWTTTPWTLPANRAIAVNRGLEYCIIDTSKHGRLIIASAALDEAHRYLGEEHTIFDRVKGEDLEGQLYIDPIESSSPGRLILHADFVSATMGTGLVHIAPGHGMDDYDLCMKSGIDAFAPVDDVGCFTSLAFPSRKPRLEGKSVLDEGTEAVLEMFLTTGALVKRHTFIHRYPYDWRTKQPVIIRATEQWFADVGRIQAEALESLGEVKFVPPGGRDRLRSFLLSRKEWCMSRQRAWGVPIPALYHEKTGKAILTAESVDHIISQIRNRGMASWWTDPSNDPGWIAPSLRTEYGGSAFRRGKDTMDVWFDSGTSWTQTRPASDNQMCAPADMYLEGTDQHRGWFQSSLLTYVAQQTGSKARNGTIKAPFKTLITHGFVLDSAGRKMSKSIGNVISPHEIIAGTLLPTVKKGKFDAMGPDALRLWVAMSDYTDDVKVNASMQQSVHSHLAKYRTTFKFMLGVLGDLEEPVTVQPEGLRSSHRMALLQLGRAFRKVHECYGRGDYSQAINEVNRYIVNDLSGFYLESVKDVLYAERGDLRRQAQSTLLIIHQCLQTMLGPVTPLLIEEVWGYSPAYIRNNYPHALQVTWAEHHHILDPFAEDTQLAMDLSVVTKAISAVRTAQETARSMKLMASGLESHVILQMETVVSCFERHLPDLAMLFVVSGVEIGAPPMHIEVMAAQEFDVDGTKVVAHVCRPFMTKCARCWRLMAPPDATEDEALCERCDAVMDAIIITNPELFP